MDEPKICYKCVGFKGKEYKRINRVSRRKLRLRVERDARTWYRGLRSRNYRNWRLIYK